MIDCGLPGYAKAWVQSDNEMRAADSDVRAATNRRSEALAARDRVEAELMKRVGRNIRERIFDVGDAFLVVEHERGVRRVEHA